MLCALAGALTACGGFAPQPLPVGGDRIRLSCFSFLPPGEFGWMTAPGDQWSFAATRAGTARDETYGFMAEVNQVSPIASDEELLELGRKNATLKPEDAERFAVTRSDISLWPRLGARCVRLDVSLVNRSTPSTSSAPARVLRAVSFTCLNPHCDDVGITLGLAQQCAQGHEDPTLPQKAEELALTLEFLGD